MAIRVDREIFDPVGVGSTAGGTRFAEDGTRQAPWQPRPFTSRQEFYVSQAMEMMAMPADVIRQIRPPMLVDPFPEMFGYDQTPLTIEAVLQTDRWAPQIRSWMSGTPRKIRRADMQADSTNASLRNFTASPNPAG